eukprot:CAMPEP_0113953028 /NCGR_PEP_ID=MMETSP1339-20121228/90756_1 /TAXON_ID=94617 /ORGANISM="Fibrocapsa japonica" /LENGTH=328 /DNA_ID=CAMNT_0000961727 /DNA_START=55 /DNA_END=1038 /DNA_ORIENTATION=+ /assembly_acc=CAM_ASM_000762
MASKSAETVLPFKDKLEKAIAKESNGESKAERIIDLIGRLNEVPVTVDDLRDTKVGLTIGKLRKHSDQSVAGAAKKLLKKWKRMAEGEMTGEAAANTPAPAPSPPAASNGASEEGVASNGGSGEGAPAPAPDSGSGDKKKADDEGGVPDLVQGEEGLVPQRLKVRERMFTIFTQDVDASVQKGAAAAREVEAAIHEIFNFSQKTKEYSAKVRQLNFNLKKNSKLRADVVNGSLAPDLLVQLSSDELATDDLRNERARIREDAINASRSDWDAANDQKLNAMCGIKQMEGLFQCFRCKSKKTTHTQKQTRSADEPMTVFVTCLNCGNRW